MTKEVYLVPDVNACVANRCGVMGIGSRRVMGIGIPLALGAAVYTAFLFGQAEGRDLWQSSLLPVHLVVQALMAGAAFGLIPWAGLEIGGLLRTSLLVLLAADLVVTFMGEVWMPHASDTAVKAAKQMVYGKYRNHFWIGSVLMGHIVPFLMLLFSANAVVAGVAGARALVGLYLYEHAYVTAPQEIPNS